MHETGNQNIRWKRITDQQQWPPPHHQGAPVPVFLRVAAGGVVLRRGVHSVPALGVGRVGPRVAPPRHDGHHALHVARRGRHGIHDAPGGAHLQVRKTERDKLRTISNSLGKSHNVTQCYLQT